MKEDADRREWLTYKRLNRLRVANVALSEIALNRLAEIEQKYPAWDLEGSERDEFAIWSQMLSAENEGADEFSSLAISKILPAIRKKDSRSRFAMGGSWRAFTQLDSAKAFAAIRDDTARTPNNENGSEWQQLFWTLREPSDDLPLQSGVLDYVIENFSPQLDNATDAIANWLQAKDQEILEIDGNPDRVLAAWDQLSVAISQENANPVEDHNDLMGAVLNDASGVLPDILIDLIDVESDTFDDCLKSEVLKRLDEAISWEGEKGTVAQACLLQRLPWLETIYPDWVMDRLAPTLNVRDVHWLGRWQARFYHSHPGSSALFALTKRSFLETFDHSNEIPNNELQTNLFLSAVLNAIANPDWPLTPAEAKKTLLRGGEVSLSDVCRILWGRDGGEGASDHWHEVVKPALKFAWPLDGATSTRKTTSGLVRLIFEAGDAFDDAVMELKDFLQPEWTSNAWDIEHQFEKDGLDVALNFPERLLLLLVKIVNAENPPSSLNQVLDAVIEQEPGLSDRPEFRKLRGLARKSAA